MAASVNGFTASAIKTLEGRSKYNRADSEVIGKFSNKRLQYLTHEATSNLSEAINTSNKLVGVFDVKVQLYIKCRRSMNAASSAPPQTHIS